MYTRIHVNKPFLDFTGSSGAKNDGGGASPVLKKRKSAATGEATAGGIATPKSAKRQKTAAAATPSSGSTSEAPQRTPQIRAQLRAKNNEPTLRWRSLMRKKVENQAQAKVSLFRSPSIFDKEEGGAGVGGDDDDVMAKYLAGQMVPLTPSQAPTNVSHLVKYKPAAVKEQACSDGSTLSESFSLKTPRRKQRKDDTENSELCDDVTMSTPPAPDSQSYCSIM